MLTVDLIRVRRRGDRLVVVPIADDERPRARELASTVLDLVRAHLGLPRGTLLEAWGQVPMAPSESLLARGLFKLALDACEFDEGTALDPVELRQQVFAAAARARRESQETFDRATILDGIAQLRGMDPDAVEEALYADLPTAHVLRKADLPSPDGLLAMHDLASRQAVLFRAVNVRAKVFCAGPAGYRQLFRRLKFHRLLFSTSKLDRGAGYAIEIDGPFSLFEQTTKYGLQLALALPALMECDAWDVDAELRWGKERRPLRFHLRGGAGERDGEQTTVPSMPPDEIATLLEDLRRLGSSWHASLSDEILDLPGTGVCVPDLRFVHRETGQVVFFEVLGFWSRAAVWKRIELAQAGLSQAIVFAVGKHLRVSEEAMPEHSPAALYVYARAMHARGVLERVEEVARRRPPPSSA